MPEEVRRHVVLIAAAVAALVVGGWQLLRPPAGDGDTAPPAELALSGPGGGTSATPRRAAPAAPALVVHVAGAVRRPGVYRLPDGARVALAVRRAGGPSDRADLAAVNLAARAADGQQVLVPERGATAAAPAGAPTAEGPVSLSTATVEQLDALEGIGPKLAQAIVDYRDRHGGFRSIEELDQVDGIGESRLARLREHVTR